MKICAIIAEFNPFHKGHQKLIEMAKKQTGCDAVFCFMGQNFSQRGKPAIINKSVRAKMAILSGADAVFEIPNALTLTNAEIFAKSMIKAVLSFKNVTHIVFGSECGDIEKLKFVAQIMNDEPKQFKEFLEEELKSGNSLNLSKQIAFEKYLKNCQKDYNAKDYKKIISLPNNILGVEYIKALLSENSKVTPVATTRVEDFSATEIRELCYSKKIIKTRPLLGDNYDIFCEALNEQTFPDLTLFNNLKLLSLRQHTFDLTKIQDVSEGLEHKLVLEAQKCVEYGDFLKATTNKRYGENRIERIALSNLLEIDKEVIKKTLNQKFLPYIKVLAIRKDKKLLNEISNAQTKVIMRKNDADGALKRNKLAQELNEIDTRCEMLYSLLTHKTPNKNDLYTKLNII